MIEKARATGLYAELEVTDMLEGLRSTPDSGAELVLSADAMVYVADLVSGSEGSEPCSGFRRPFGFHLGKARRRRFYHGRGQALRS